MPFTHAQKLIGHTPIGGLTQCVQSDVLQRPFHRGTKGHMFLRLICMTLCMVNLSLSLQAQNVEAYCDPGLEGMPRPKFMELSYERIMNYGISSQNNLDSRLSYQGNIRRNAKWGAKIRVPLLRSEKMQVSTTLQYHTESLALSHSGLYPEANLIDNLGGNTFHKIGTTLYVQRPFKGNRFMTLRAKGALNYEDIANDDLLKTAFRHTVSLLYGIKKSPSKRIQFGVAYSYTFGRARIYPLFSYERVYANNTRLQLVLPAFVELEKDLNRKTRIVFRSELDGANYKVDISGIGLYGPYVLERSDLKTHIGFERELHDWMWCAVSAGVDYNIGFSLVNNHRLSRGDVIVENDVRPAFFVKATLFIVPPRKLWNRLQ